MHIPSENPTWTTHTHTAQRCVCVVVWDQQSSSLGARGCLCLLTCLRAGGVSSVASGVEMMSPSLPDFPLTTEELHNHRCRRRTLWFTHIHPLRYLKSAGEKRWRNFTLRLRKAVFYHSLFSFTGGVVIRKHHKDGNESLMTEGLWL